MVYGVVVWWCGGEMVWWCMVYGEVVYGEVVRFAIKL